MDSSWFSSCSHISPLFRHGFGFAQTFSQHCSVCLVLPRALPHNQRRGACFITFQKSLMLFLHQPCMAWPCQWQPLGNLWQTANSAGLLRVVLQDSGSFRGCQSHGRWPCSCQEGCPPRCCRGLACWGVEVTGPAPAFVQGPLLPRVGVWVSCWKPAQPAACSESRAWPGDLLVSCRCGRKTQVGWKEGGGAGGRAILRTSALQLDATAGVMGVEPLGRLHPGCWDCAAERGSRRRQDAGAPPPTRRGSGGGAPRGCPAAAGSLPSPPPGPWGATALSDLLFPEAGRPCSLPPSPCRAERPLETQGLKAGRWPGNE